MSPERAAILGEILELSASVTYTELITLCAVLRELVDASAELSHAELTALHARLRCNRGSRRRRGPAGAGGEPAPQQNERATE